MMKVSRIVKAGFVMALTAAITFSGTGIGDVRVHEVYATDTPYAGGTATPTVPKAVLADVLKPYKVNPGDTVEVTIPVKASNYVIRQPIINVDLSKTSGFTLASDVTYTSKDNKVNSGSISITDTTYIKFSVYIPLNAKKGTYNDIPIKILTTNSYNEYTEVTLDQVSKLTFVVNSQKKTPTFTFMGAEYPDEIRDSDEFDLTVTLKNDGELAAKNVKVVLSGYETSFRIGGAQSFVELGDVGPGGSIEANYTLTAAKNLTTGLAQLVATVKYENEDGTEGTAQTFNIALQTVAKEADASNRPVIQVVNVDYPTYTVTPKESFGITYTFKNTSKFDAKNVVIDVTGYTDAGFKTQRAYDKVRLKTLKAGKSYKFTRYFIAGENITTGLKNITANFTYYSASDAALSTQITDSIATSIDVKGNDSANDVDNSTPVLVISKYSTGDKKIVTGEVFDFSFEVMNSNSSASADNIKATVSSADNSFAIVEGSPSFVIDSLKPGQKKTCKLPLRVKGDIATNGYDLSITFDYEYLTKDVANHNALVKKTNKSEEKLKLQVYSNDRPSLLNINVGDGDIPIYMESTALTFDFNNMGKSTLYNVTAKVTGDFKPKNEVLIIGNVEAGAGRSWAIDVVPNAQGHGKGVVTITYEDLNGNAKSYDTEFESDIREPESEDGGMDQPFMPAEEPKKDIIPVWAFAGLEIVIFILAAVVTSKKVVKNYKKKKLAEIEREDEEL